MLEKIFSGYGYECQNIDYRKILKNWETKINTQMFRLPDKVRIKWEKYFFSKINRWYRTQIAILKPDIVFIYNNEMLLPSTLKEIKNQKKKILFYLGDNPLFTPTSRYNIDVLQYADAVFVPDTFWQMQLKKIGLPHVHHLLPPLPEKQYFKIDGFDSDAIKKYQTDIVYVGMCYNDSWGYKKACFLNWFTGYNLQIYGNKAWKRWFRFFPELEKHYTESNYVPYQRLNIMYNAAKIVPVDGNPAIFNGIHLRVFESLSSGTLPLMEWNADMDFVFKDITDLPAIKDYRAIPETLEFFLGNNEAREQTVHEMKQAYSKQYNSSSVVDKILKALE